jgi:two-component system chemotaxis response regulator CheB
MRVLKKPGGYQIALDAEEPAIGGLKPCADIMYESLLRTDFDDIICVVMTGMGGDGTLGIKKLNGKKNIYVISQDEPSCIVYGMPKVIYETGLVDEVVPLSGIAGAIAKSTGVI